MIDVFVKNIEQVNEKLCLLCFRFRCISENLYIFFVFFEMNVLEN